MPRVCHRRDPTSVFPPQTLGALQAALASDLPSNDLTHFLAFGSMSQGMRSNVRETLVQQDGTALFVLAHSLSEYCVFAGPCSIVGDICDSKSGWVIIALFAASTKEQRKQLFATVFRAVRLQMIIQTALVVCKRLDVSWFLREDVRNKRSKWFMGLRDSAFE